MRSDVGAVRQTWIFLLQPALQGGRSRLRLIRRLWRCAARGHLVLQPGEAQPQHCGDAADRVGLAFDAGACLSAEVAHSFEIGDQARARRVPSENFLRVRT